MNPLTEARWDVLEEAFDDDQEVCTDLKALLSKDYQPFVTRQQAQDVHVHHVHTSLLDTCTQWVEWLPETLVNQLGRALVQAARAAVSWSTLTTLLRARLIPAVSESEATHART